MTVDELLAMNPQLDPSITFTEDVQMCDGGATYTSSGGCPALQQRRPRPLHGGAVPAGSVAALVWRSQPVA